MSVFTIEAFLAILGLALLLVEAFVPQVSRRTIAAASIGGTALALVLFFTAASHAPDSLPAFCRPWMQLDQLALFYKGFFLVITLLVLWLTHECAPYLGKYTLEGRLTEMFSLPLIVCAGMMWMAAAQDLVTVFVTLELVTVSFYVLVALARKSSLALEAGVKYLILGALSTGVLVFGIAWITAPRVLSASKASPPRWPSPISPRLRSSLARPSCLQAWVSRSLPHPSRAGFPTSIRGLRFQ
jgi:NADH-quinone oxidoreductase subunit N